MKMKNLLVLAALLPCLMMCTQPQKEMKAPVEEKKEEVMMPAKVQKTMTYKESQVSYYGNKMVTEEELLKETKLIDIADRRFESKWANEDPVGISNEYTTDGIFLKPGVEPKLGRAAIAEEFARSVEGVERVEFFQDELEFYGDMTVAFQRAHMKGYLRGSEEIFYGSYVILWKKANGEWLIHYDMYNADK